MNLTPFDPEFLKSLNRDSQYMLDTVNRAMGNTQSALKAFTSAIKKMPDSIKILAEEGWYLPLDLVPSEINSFATCIKEGDIKKVDKEMISFFDNEIARIQKELNAKFPKRKKAINAAIKAHLNHDYFLSIPVFFAQIEGICDELIGIRYFKNPNGIPKTKDWLIKFQTDSVLRMLLEPLSISGPMRMPQDLSKPIGINRHDVLHGASNNYGSKKINSYKVLSLLYYISDTVYDAKKFLENNNST
jgi:hypothetical protein